jgi:NitT/TauT family transport system substrate-binding protein
VLSAFDPNVARARIDLKRTYTNALVDRALKMVK